VSGTAGVTITDQNADSVGGNVSYVGDGSAVMNMSGKLKAGSRFSRSPMRANTPLP